MCSAEKCSKIYLVTLNSLVILAGFCLIVLSIFLAVHYKGYGEMIKGVFIWTPLGVGFGMLFVGLLGCLGAVFTSRGTLFCYTFINSILIIFAIVLGIFLLVEVKQVVDAGDVEDSATITKSALQDITSVEAVLFNRCCFEHLPISWGEPEVELCPCNVTPPSGCMCYAEQAVYDYQDHHFQTDGCEVLEGLKVEFDGAVVPLVGDRDSGGCGGGDPKTFQKVLGEYAQIYIAPGGWAVLITGIVLLVGLCLACLLICRAERSKKKRGYQPTEDDRLAKEVEAEDQNEGTGVELQKADQEVSFT